jgi:hypothetical protein
MPNSLVNANQKETRTFDHGENDRIPSVKLFLATRLVDPQLGTGPCVQYPLYVPELFVVQN